jgi:hypothetical protein
LMTHENTQLYQPAKLGCQLRTGARQSIPSSNMETCAGDKAIAPIAVTGQINLPFSSLLANKQRPWVSHHKSLIKSPRRPRKMNRAPE